MEWEEICKDREFVKWERPGQTLSGIFSGLRDGEFGKLGDIDDGDGLVPFGCPTVLARKLQRVPLGTLITIEFTHTEKVGAGTLKQFKIRAPKEGTDTDGRGDTPDSVPSPKRTRRRRE